MTDVPADERDRVREAACEPEGGPLPAAPPDADFGNGGAEALDWPGRPRRRGPGIFVSIACIGLCAYLLFEMRHALAYWLTAPGEAVVLDEKILADAEALDVLDNRLVRLRGTPGSSAARFKKRFAERELVALGGTPVLLERPPTRAPAARAASTAPPPDRAPVDVEGRLVRDTSLDRDYAVAFAAFVQRREAELRGGHLYVLFQDERPRDGLSLPLTFLGLALLILVNGRYLARALR